MLKSEIVKVKVSSGLKQNYSNLSYDFTKSEVDFNVCDLKESSNQKVEVICDLCKMENILYSYTQPLCVSVVLSSELTLVLENFRKNPPHIFI